MREKYIVTTLFNGKREIWAKSKEAARKAATARGWRVVEIKKV